MGTVARFEPVLRPSSLEDVFPRLTGRDLAGGA
jgi:hypothetical protein